MPQLAFAHSFWESYDVLEKLVKAGVRKATAKFQALTIAQLYADKGLHLESVEQSQDPRMRTIRVIDLEMPGVGWTAVSPSSALEAQAIILPRLCPFRDPEPAHDGISQASRMICTDDIIGRDSLPEIGTAGRQATACPLRVIFPRALLASRVRPT